MTDQIRSEYRDDHDRREICKIIEGVATKKEILQFFDIMILHNNLDNCLANPILKAALPILFDKFKQHLSTEQKKILLEKLGEQHEDLRNALLPPSLPPLTVPVSLLNQVRAISSESLSAGSGSPVTFHLEQEKDKEPNTNAESTNTSPSGGKLGI